MDPSPRSSSPLAADDSYAAFSPRGGYCCFCIPRSSVLFHRIRSTDDRSRSDSAAPSRPRKWWRTGVAALMKAREWSEIVAGPKWKTFIRRFNRNPRHHHAGGGNAQRFVYDPLSYSLNFDGGNGGATSPERDYGYPDFSTRFVAPPASAKSSMDFGGRDATALFVPPLPAAAVH